MLWRMQVRPARAAPVCSVSACEPSAVLELNAKLKDAETKRISAEEKLKLLDAQLQRAQHQVT